MSEENEIKAKAPKKPAKTGSAPKPIGKPKSAKAPKDNPESSSDAADDVSPPVIFPGSDADIRTAAAAFDSMRDVTRMKIMMALMAGPRNVREICGLFKITQPAISHHIALMRQGRYIEPDRQGKSNFYSLTELGEIAVKCAEMMITSVKAS